jgi:hypothetical protein
MPLTKIQLTTIKNMVLNAPTNVKTDAEKVLELLIERTIPRYDTAIKILNQLLSTSGVSRKAAKAKIEKYNGKPSYFTTRAKPKIPDPEPEQESPKQFDSTKYKYHIQYRVTSSKKYFIKNETFNEKSSSSINVMAASKHDAVEKFNTKMNKLYNISNKIYEQKLLKCEITNIIIYNSADEPIDEPKEEPPKTVPKPEPPKTVPPKTVPPKTVPPKTVPKAQPPKKEPPKPQPKKQPAPKPKKEPKPKPKKEPKPKKQPPPKRHSFDINFNITCSITDKKSNSSHEKTIDNSDFVKAKTKAEAIEEFNYQTEKKYNTSNRKTVTKIVSYTILQIYEYNSLGERILIYEKNNKFVFEIMLEDISKEDGIKKSLYFTIYATTYDEAVKKLDNEFVKYNDFICKTFNTTMDNLNYEVHEVVEYPIEDHEAPKETDPVVKDADKLPEKKIGEDTYEFLVEMLIQHTVDTNPNLIKKVLNDDKLFAKKTMNVIIFAKTNKQAFDKLEKKIETSYHVLAKKLKFATTLDVKVVEAVKYDGVTGRMSVIDPDEDDKD